MRYACKYGNTRFRVLPKLSSGLVLLPWISHLLCHPRHLAKRAKPPTWQTLQPDLWETCLELAPSWIFSRRLCYWHQQVATVCTETKNKRWLGEAHLTAVVWEKGFSCTLGDWCLPALGGNQRPIANPTNHRAGAPHFPAGEGQFQRGHVPPLCIAYVMGQSSLSLMF